MGSNDTTTTRGAETSSDDNDETALLAMELASGSVVPMVLKAVIELGVLDIIAGAGPGAALSGAEIAAHLPAATNPGAGDMVDRMLRLLGCYSAVTCSVRGDSGERVYGLTPVSKFLTNNDDGVSLAHLCLMNQDKAYLASWHHLKASVLEGGVPFNKAHGMSVFEYRKQDPVFNKIFNKTMFDNSTITMKKLLETYKGFEGLSTVVDVGGGTGALLRSIVAKYPSINGINFDLPHVIKDAPAYPGVEHVSGDMFVSVPRGDAILLKSVIHNWSDEQCLKFLKNCYDALSENGKVVVIESTLPEASDTSLVAKRVVRIDVVMLAHNPGGRERTEKEYEALAKAAGFKGCRMACNALYTKVLEYLKN